MLLPPSREVFPKEAQGDARIVFSEDGERASRLRLSHKGAGNGLALAIALLLAVVLCLPALGQSAPSFPPLTGRVVDAAAVLKPEERTRSSKN